MAFENGVLSEDWRFDVIVPLYKFKGISLLSVLEKNICRDHSR